MRRAAVSPNDLLRAVRENTASPQTPGESLTRQELAEQVNRWIFTHGNRVAELDGNYVGKLERGIIRWPQAAYRAAMRAVLDVEEDRDLGFHRPRRTRNTTDAVNRQQFLKAAAVTGIVLPQWPAAAAEPATVRTADLLGPLRCAVTEPPAWPGPREPSPTAVGRLRTDARDAHRHYQQADYDGAATLVTAVVRAVDALAADPPPGTSSRDLHEIRSTAYLAAAKLAAKVSDHDLAWLTADRAYQSATTAGLPVLAATAHRQIACVFHETRRTADAERVALTAAEWLTRTADPADPDVVSVSGSLYLLAAVSAAGRADRIGTRQRLALAHQHAERLGADQNRVWSAFGPTNVAIHALSVALTFDEPRDAVAVAGRIDTLALPPHLVGRRAQVHVDVAEAHSRLGDHVAATVHVLEIERIAPQLLHLNAQARRAVVATLRRARGSTVPVLRGVAERAGISA